MKKLLNLSFVLLCVGAIFTSCQKEALTSDPETSGPAASTEVNSLSFGKGGIKILNTGATGVITSDITDASGLVNLRLYFGSLPSGTDINGEIDADPGYVMIGGGPIIGDAWMTQNTPNSTLTKWLVSTKGTSAPAPKMFAISLKLLDAFGTPIPASTLMSYLSVNTTISTATNTPTRTTVTPAGYTLIGGGGEIVSPTGTFSLTQLYSDLSANSWLAGAKGLTGGTTAQVRSTAIGFDNAAFLLAYGYSLSIQQDNTIAAAPGLGAYFTFNTPPNGWQYTSLGGFTIDGSAGPRGIVNLYPGMLTVFPVGFDPKPKGYIKSVSFNTGGGSGWGSQTVVNIRIKAI